MNNMNFSDEMINMVLRQMGAASIKTTPGHINIAKFPITPEMIITYMYDIEDAEGIYLQRIEPYPKRIGKLYSEQDLINIISGDLRKFKAAAKSSNYDKFIKVAGNVLSFDREIENLFLMHNVAGADLEKLDEKIDEIHMLIKEVAERSELM
ncbi:MAG: hypothetical protein VB031_00705 [Eubacteriaceae bacterium]|nr:hypothetical protein [Eubacteriaceae bacterium]